MGGRSGGARDWGLHGIEHLQRLAADPDGQCQRDLRRGAPLGMRGNRARDLRFTLAAAGLAASGTPEQIARWVPRVLRPRRGGQARRLRGHRAAGRLRRQEPRTTAKRDGDEWVLNGTKVFITNGGIADVHVVVATVDPGARTPGPGLIRGRRRARPGLTPGKEGVEARHPRLAHGRGDPRGLPDTGREPARWRWRSSSASWSAPAPAESTGRASNALATFELTRPVVGASALGIAQAAYEWTLAHLDDGARGPRNEYWTRARRPGSRRSSDRASSSGWRTSQRRSRRRACWCSARRGWAATGSR